jgi:DNA-binding transcriptional regulator LsrR (DeoR family)
MAPNETTACGRAAAAVSELDRGEGVKTQDVAKRLEISRSCASEALRDAKAKGLIRSRGIRPAFWLKCDLTKSNRN